ncbi:MAG TPA: PQQ-dependent sugar dehydrogenase, partial [Labilithrix sp.]|nr:PQQ-dependent sugar dehydrogenase [Labilithrix sp.]
VGYRVRWLLCAAAFGCLSCGQASSAGSGQQKPGLPLETRSANGRAQKPAFVGQTRAPFLTADVSFEVHTIARGLERPWGLAFLQDGAMLVTEKRGRMRIVGADGALSAPLAGVPRVESDGQAGLLDVTLSPNFGGDSLVYFAYSEPRTDGNGTAVARARLARDGAPRLEDVQVIWRMTPTIDSNKHFGCRLVFAPDGMLFVTTGDRYISQGRKQVQTLDDTLGKVVRIKPDGTAPPDNPFVNKAGALPEIFSLGHRNVQAAAIHPRTGELWIVDHGARGGDEINIVRAGRNYGWPIITYGVEYSGRSVGEGLTQREGLEQPLYYWDPSIAPSGMAFYEAELFPRWKGSLFVGALAGEHLARLTLDGERVIGEERLLVDRARIRDVRVGPSGAVYVLTDESNGELLTLVPR